MTIAPPKQHFPTAQDQRQSDILGAVRLAFVEKGFDGASMQDLARAAGISVGNFYRYFPSKDAIVEAIVTRELAEVERDFATILLSAQPLEAMRATLRHRITSGVCDGDAPLWAEITATATRKPEIGAILGRMDHEIRQYLLRVFALVTRRDPAEVNRRYRSHAELIMLLVMAQGMRIPVPDTDDTELNELILRTIYRTLDEVATDAVKV